MFKVNDIVKFNEKWCEEGERECRFVVLEVGFGESNRYKIGCLNSGLSLGWVTVVDDYMIENA